MQQSLNIPNNFKCFQQHNTHLPLFINFDSRQNFEQRLLCEECLMNQECKKKVFPLQKVIDQIQEQKNKVNNYLKFLTQKTIQKINEQCNNLDIFKTKLIYLVNKITLGYNLWKEELSNLIQRKENYDLLFELEQLDLFDDQIETNRFIDLEKEFKNLNCYNINKVTVFSKELENNIKNNNNQVFELDQLFQYIQLLNNEYQNQQKYDKTIKCDYIAEIKQDNWCGAIAFNKQGSIMVSGYDQDIKVWNLKNGLPDQIGPILKGHQNQVYSIVFSKKQNWFISGCSGDDKIISWKEIKRSNEWESIKTIENVSTVWCLIINEQENQLLSSHEDGSIMVWEIKYSENLIQFDYSLQKHNSFVYQISFNKNQTKLVSCSEDKEIIIWELNKKLIWQFTYVVIKSIDDYGQRISFIDDDKIIWCSNLGHINIFQQENSKFIECLDIKFTLNAIPFSDQNNLFPLIYNKAKNIIIIKHYQHIYLLRQQLNKQFQILTEPIFCESSCIIGNLNEARSQLVVWNMENKYFRFYALN